MPLTEEEKTSIRHHLGYLNVAEAATFALGTPAGVETQFLIESAFTKVLEGALPLVRRTLCKLDATEEQMFCGQETAEVQSIGDITTNVTGEHRHQAELRRAYRWWQASLANLLGVYVNPFDKRAGAFGGGINVRVQ
jgi:hypothetical protein